MLPKPSKCLNRFLKLKRLTKPKPEKDGKRFFLAAAKRLKNLLINLISGWQSTTGSACQFNYQINLDNAKLDQNAALTLFRITQEALTNIAKHAKASNIEIKITTDPQYIYWSVIDNGLGIADRNISMQQRGNGLAGLQERLWAIGGELIINPQIDGGGFALYANIPHKV